MNMLAYYGMSVYTRVSIYAVTRSPEIKNREGKVLCVKLAFYKTYSEIINLAK